MGNVIIIRNVSAQTKKQEYFYHYFFYSFILIIDYILNVKSTRYSCAEWRQVGVEMIHLRNTPDIVVLTDCSFLGLSDDTTVHKVFYVKMDLPRDNLHKVTLHNCHS